MYAEKLASPGVPSIVPLPALFVIFPDTPTIVLLLHCESDEFYLLEIRKYIYIIEN